MSALLPVVALVTANVRKFHAVPSMPAYTARALAGMLEKVGLMEKGNLESTPMAYVGPRCYMSHDIASS